MTSQTEPYPGERLGLPGSGPGSLATWYARMGALIADWAASMFVATAMFGPAVLTGYDWRAWMVLAVFAIESTLLSTLLGGSFGKLLARLAIVRLDGKPLGLLRALARALLVCLVIPAVVVGQDRRALVDVLLGTVVVTRR